jgi:hypothetical protein
MSEEIENVGVSLDELFEMLSHEPRRRILVAVGRDNPRDEDEIASKLAATEHEGGPDTTELVKTKLYHVHLPKLDEAGFIDWDRESCHIRRGPRFEEIEPLLGLLDDHRDELPDDWP